jgi:hypothetical protein
MKNQNKIWDIITLFWTDGREDSDRERNVLFTIEKNTELVNYINQNGGNVNYIVYDFSPEKIIENSIHIPYPLSVYKRSEKINIALDRSKSDFISIIDSDCFFDGEEYPLILDLYNNLDSNFVYNFDWKKIGGDEFIDFENRTLLSKTNFNYAIGNGCVGGLGAFFITPTKPLKEIGGFDPTFTTWGGEDGDALDKLLRKINRQPITNISPYHLPHFTDWGNKLYYDR